MGHEWKVGDWAESGGTKYLVYKVSDDEVYGIRSDHYLMSCSVYDPKMKHLPGCTGWDWEEPKEVEPAAHQFEEGDWIEYRHYRCLVIDTHGDRKIKVARKDGFEAWALLSEIKHLPNCTGWDWVPNEPASEPTAEKVEPAAHEWKFGEWAKTPHGNIVRFVSVDDEGDHIPAIVCAFIATLFIAFSAFVFLLNSERRHLQNEAIERNYAEWVNDGKGNPVFTWKDPTQ